jgi:hypothetical protein
LDDALSTLDDLYEITLNPDGPPRLNATFLAEPMRMSAISTRVNNPENDDVAIVEPIALATSAA